MSAGITCYERDEELCEDPICLRVGCRIRNGKLSPTNVINMQAQIRLTREAREAREKSRAERTAEKAPFPGGIDDMEI